MGWKIRPLKPLRSAAWGKRDWLVWAEQGDEPYSTFLRLTTSAGTSMRIGINEMPFTNKVSYWQKIADNLAEQ